MFLSYFALYYKSILSPVTYKSLQNNHMVVEDPTYSCAITGKVY